MATCRSMFRALWAVSLLMIVPACAANPRPSETAAPITTAITTASTTAITTAIRTASTTASTTTSTEPLPPCGRGWSPGFRGHISVEVEGSLRTAWVIVPTRYRPGRNLALLLDVHGHETDGATALATHGFVRLAERDDAVVVAPDGRFQEDMQTTGWAYDDAGQLNDVVFIEALLREVSSQVCVDEARRWAVGHSNGGGFIGLLACKLPGRFAAFGSYGGAFYDRCTRGVPVSAMEVQGADDTVVFYDQVRGWLDRWAAIDRCQPGARTTNPDGVVVLRWVCPDGLAVEHIVVPGLTHDWPDTPGEFRAAETLWAFFQRHTL